MGTNIAERNDAIIAELDESIVDPAYIVVEACKKKGIDILIYCGYRSLEDQAIAYRSTRYTAQIYAKMESLIARGFQECADALQVVGPQSGLLNEHITGAAPGESWHQYRLAWDAVPIVGGKLIWAKYDRSWSVYGNECLRAGMEWAGNWIGKYKESPHAQHGPGSNPLKTLSNEEIHRLLAQGGVRS